MSPRYLSGRIYEPIPLSSAITERRFPMPCHHRHAVAILGGFDYHGPRQCWEQACGTCGRLYRYHNLRGVRRYAGKRCIWWHTIDALTDSEHPPHEPLDYWLMEWRRQSAA